MKKQKVFIPVDVKEELPEIEQAYFSYTEDDWMDKKVTQCGSCRMYSPKDKEFEVEEPYEAQPSHWLKEQEGYFFTADELNKLISEVYEVGFLNPIGRANYIKSLNIK